MKERGLGRWNSGTAQSRLAPGVKHTPGGRACFGALLGDGTVTRPHARGVEQVAQAGHQDRVFDAQEIGQVAQAWHLVVLCFSLNFGKSMDIRARNRTKIDLSVERLKISF